MESVLLMNNNSKSVNRIMFAAPRSGSGKTMITCGFLHLLKQMKLSVTSYKCGPDYIDPMFHKTVLGITGGNLDTFMSSKEAVNAIIQDDPHDYAVLEGVMGIYDGLGGLSMEASCYEVAIATHTPIILIIDAHGMGRTVLSVIKGILADDSEGLIKGIIFNRMSSSYYDRVEKVISEELAAAGYDVRLLGYVPVMKDMVIDSRHLGLLRPEEIEGLREKLDKISRIIKDSCKTDDILAMMHDLSPGDCDCMDDSSIEYNCCINESDSVNNDLNSQGDINNTPVRIAIANDEAFCFYYRENLKLLEKSGASLIPFSPIHDSKLPDNIQGIILGGGYPELYLKELSENISMRKSVEQAIANGVPSLAECGGFMYLHDSIMSEDSVEYSMVGVIKGCCTNNHKLTRFGYVELTNVQTDNEGDCKEDSLAKSLSGMRGHEFHYYDSTNNGEAVTLSKPGSNISYKGMHVGYNHVWGFPHLYYAGRSDFVREYIRVCRRIRVY